MFGSSGTGAGTCWSWTCVVPALQPVDDLLGALFHCFGLRCCDLTIDLGMGNLGDPMALSVNDRCLFYSLESFSHSD